MPDDLTQLPIRLPYAELRHKAEAEEWDANYRSAAVFFQRSEQYRDRLTTAHWSVLDPLEITTVLLYQDSLSFEKAEALAGKVLTRLKQTGWTTAKLYRTTGASETEIQDLLDADESR